MSSVTIALEWPGYGYEKGNKYHMERYRRGMVSVSEMGKIFGAKTRKPWIRNLKNRKFINGQFTYQGSDKHANKGVKIYYHLFNGGEYEICYWAGYKNEIRYKCEIKDGRICRKNI